MNKSLCLGLLLFSLSGFSLVPAWGNATLSVIKNFVPTPGGTGPVATLVKGDDGNFYGATQSGGISGQGTLFKMTPSGVLTVLHSFNGLDGVGPTGLTLGEDGNFYGATSGGGPALSPALGGLGTLFKITPAGVFTTLATFNGKNGQDPASRLTKGSDGNFYGVTLLGGSDFSAENKIPGNGTAYKLTPAGVLTSLVSFSTKASLPSGDLVEGTNGCFYGTTSGGGTLRNGTVFEVTQTGVLTIIYSFLNSDGGGSYGSLVKGKDGSFYGTAPHGGPGWGLGLVFKVSRTGARQTLYNFSGAEGREPAAGMILGLDGNFYGNTHAGGADSNGILFKMTPTGTLTVMASLKPSLGATCRSRLLQDADGTFYGALDYPSTVASNAAFKMTPDGAVTKLHTFSATMGASPVAGLVPGKDGNLYGTTPEGGQSDNGTVFKVTTAGKLTTLISFDFIHGARPRAGLILGLDDNFYGLLPTGLPNLAGSIFRIGADGAFANLTPFAQGTESAFDAGVIQAQDGNFYAAMRNRILKLTPSGILTTVYTFDADGGEPSDLIQGKDGNFYGTTSAGGPSRQGTVFRLTPRGALTTLVTFTGPNGRWPHAGLVQGRDGNFYGTTTSSGYDGYFPFGTVFKVTPKGVLTTLAAFDGLNGMNPEAALIQGLDGNFYGTTVTGTGEASHGTIFQLKAGAEIRTVATFDGSNGASPQGALVQMADGIFYGTTPEGGTAMAGVVFKCTLPTPQAQTITFPAVGPVYSPRTVTLSARSTSGLPVSYSVLSGHGTVSGNQLNLTGAGVVKVAANQAGNLDFEAAKQVVINVRGQ